MESYKYYKLIIAFSFIISVIFGFFSTNEVFLLGIIEKSNIVPNKDITLIECFTTIFFTNFIVGFFILFIMSFVTGGLLAIFVIFINGFILGRLFLELLNIEQISLKVKFFSIIHIPVEIYAFFLFSFYSYNGFYLILDMLKNDRINKTFFPSKEKILKPTLLLLLGAIIESLTIYYAIL